jgi:hypothetical protein
MWCRPRHEPYELGTWAAFSYANFNGRTFADNVKDVSLMTSTALGDDAPIPARPRKRAKFPYYGEPDTGI